MDVLNSEQRSRNMRAIKSKGTKAEIDLSKAIWAIGLRFRKNNKKVFGKPDLTFTSKKVAVFVDGEFFHGRNWQTEKYRIKSNRQFWWPKIESNIERDNRVNKTLVDNGWIVLRFWETEIRKNLAYCVYKVKNTLENAEKIHGNRRKTK